MNKNKILTSLAGAALVFSSFAGSVFAETSIEISGNGSHSDNNVEVSQRSESHVTQENNSVIRNEVSSNVNTGGNEANDNTGGDVSITTGDATSNVAIFNRTGSNFATNPFFCNCHEQNTEVSVIGNGSHSDNDVAVQSSSQNSIHQDNNAQISNEVSSNANTGGNESSSNTGSPHLNWDQMIRWNDGNSVWLNQSGW